MQPARNVLGGPLNVCGTDPLTGFTRKGSCETGHQDAGSHVVCARVTADFLLYSKATGNDLITPAPAFGFPGLKPGDDWCLCAQRWTEALEDGVAPPIRLAATHARLLDYVDLEVLKAHALDD